MHLNFNICLFSSIQILILQDNFCRLIDVINSSVTICWRPTEMQHFVFDPYRYLKGQKKMSQPFRCGQNHVKGKIIHAHVPLFNPLPPEFFFS